MTDNSTVTKFLENKHKNFKLVQQVAIDLELCDSIEDHRAVLGKYSAISMSGTYITFRVPHGERGASEVRLHLPTMCVYREFGGVEATARYLLDYSKQRPLQRLADELAYPDLKG